MGKEEISLKARSLLRKAGLSGIPKPALIGICAMGIALVCLAAWQFWPRPSDNFAVASVDAARESETFAQAEDIEGTRAPIIVDIEGAVANPGLYELEEESRIGDAVKAAGGFASDAYPGNVNLAQKLNDGEQVKIPREGDQSAAQASATPETTASASATQSASPAEAKININTANSAELQKLSGIGPSLSERIIDYRTANGAFKSIEDLKKVSGIGETRFTNLKDKICI